MNEKITSVIFIIGIALIGLAFITSVGFAFYWWAHTMTLPMALWSGFVLWLKMIGAGLVFTISGLALSELR